MNVLRIAFSVLFLYLIDRSNKLCLLSRLISKASEASTDQTVVPGMYHNLICHRDSSPALIGSDLGGLSIL